MTIQLTSAYNPGDMDSGNTYGELKIINQKWDLSVGAIEITTQYGNTISAVWIPGKVPIKSYVIRDISPATDYTDMITNTLTSATGVKVYDEVAKALYQYLIDQGYFSGTVV